MRLLLESLGLLIAAMWLVLGVIDWSTPTKYGYVGLMLAMFHVVLWMRDREATRMRKEIAELKERLRS